MQFMQPQMSSRLWEFFILALWVTEDAHGRRLVSKVDIVFITQVANFMHEIFDQLDITKCSI